MDPPRYRGRSQSLVRRSREDRLTLSLPLSLSFSFPRSLPLSLSPSPSLFPPSPSPRLSGEAVWSGRGECFVLRFVFPAHLDGCFISFVLVGRKPLVSGEPLSLVNRISEHSKLWPDILGFQRLR